jgi:hypothetical protein
MKTKSLINKFKKAGYEFQQGRNSEMFIVGKLSTISFYDQDGQAVCLSYRRNDDHTDIMTDYHAETFCHTIGMALEWFLNDENK